MVFNCRSCGAQLDESMARCPYCGTLIPDGAEKEYMEKLDDIREDMDSLHAVPGDSVRVEVRRQGRRLRGIIIAAVLAAAVLAGLFFLQSRRYGRDNTADYIWGRENFPLFSELYESGEYDELTELVLQAMEEDRPIWEWEYCDEFFDYLEAQP